jgi:hypothetical protein
LLRPKPDSDFYLQTSLAPFFCSRAIINICQTQSTRVRLRALARRLRQIGENIRLVPGNTGAVPSCGNLCFSRRGTFQSAPSPSKHAGCSIGQRQESVL